jgi:uncharacterized protein YbjT (DUF2867 family)
MVKALLEANFEVTAITRKSSAATFPPEITVRRVDFSSHESLVDALRGQDAVVSTIALEATGGQESLIDAAIAAKVSRFIPSEYGVNLHVSRNLRMGRILASKIKTADYLAELAREHKWFSWTGLATNWFFDWVCSSWCCRSYLDLAN